MLAFRKKNIVDSLEIHPIPLCRNSYYGNKPKNMPNLTPKTNLVFDELDHSQTFVSVLVYS